MAVSGAGVIATMMMRAAAVTYPLLRRGLVPRRLRRIVLRPRFGRLRASRQQRAQLLGIELAPLTDAKSAQPHVDEAHALQAPHVVAEHLAHAPDLRVQHLRQNDA